MMRLGLAFGFYQTTRMIGATDRSMLDIKPEFLTAIESVVGTDHVTKEPALEIDGLRPMLLVSPGCSEEVVSCLKVCAQFHAAVVPAGEMTWLDFGNPAARADVVLGLHRMRRIIEYSPPDLTATVEAGLTLKELNDAASRGRQWLPLDPPGAGRASLGAIAACSSSGALRLGFGTPRDYVIGLRLAHADGTESKCGGRVVKNVAGYDMSKLYVGSYGTLAVITELTFKLRPLPERDSTILIASERPGALLSLARRILASQVQPASVVFVTRLPGLAEDSLLVRFIDNEAAVEHQIASTLEAVGDAERARVLEEIEAEEIWKEVADFDRHEIRIRFSVPLSEVSARFEKALAGNFEYVATADFGAAIIRMAFDADERRAVEEIRRLRANAMDAGGALFVEKAPAMVRGEIDAWGEAGSTDALMREVKKKFDPQSLLNPGKFVSGM